MYNIMENEGTKQYENLTEKAFGDTHIYCNSCQTETAHYVDYYDPDDPSGLKVWVCADCYETNDFVD